MGHDILARYLIQYSQARQLTDLERPWGLGDDGLDGLWMRLNHALTKAPQTLDRLVNELGENERRQIVRTITPLIFALPIRDYPAELRATKSGARMLLVLRHYTQSKKHDDEPVGFLPAALMNAFLFLLKDTLHIPADAVRRELTVSTGGRRRRVRVTFLTRQSGVLIRFLRRIPSPAEDNRH
jgi:hypothetical protein